jgi:DNA-3-methyladenine glycosylase
VAAAFGIDRSMTGVDLCAQDSDLRLEPAQAGWAPGPESIRATPRIGVDYAGEPWSSVPWRLVLAGHPSVSGPAAGR